MKTPEKIDVLADVCFACGRKLGKRAERMVVDTRDGQEVHVGADCFKHVQAAGDAGYQPPKGGPRLYPMTTKGALAVMKDCCASLGGDEAEQLHQARAAVAELIASDKEYDEALDAYHDAQMGGIGSSLYQLSEGDPTVIRLREASSRRAAALARVQGEGA